MIEEKIRAINRWLRYNTDYQVSIDLIASFGTIKVTVIKKGDHQKTWIGKSLEKRLDEVIKYLEMDTGDIVKGPCITCQETTDRKPILPR